jgi:hypothetical protein
MMASPAPVMMAPPAAAAVVYIPAAPHIRPVTPFELVNTNRPFILQSCLGFAAGVAGHHPGSPLTLSPLDHINPNIRWTLTATGDGGYRIHTQMHPHMVLHQHGGVFDNGGPVTLVDSRTIFAHHTHVMIEPHPDGWTIRFRHSGKCLTASAAAIGAPLYQWDVFVAESNRWRFLAC